MKDQRYRAILAAIAEARVSVGLTQRQLAAKLKRSDSFIWKIEAGRRRLDLRDFLEIARAIEVDPTELFRRGMKG